MKKSELIKRLKDARKTEESIISISAEHIQAITVRSGISEIKKEKVIAFLQEIIDDSKGHRETVETMIANIEQEERNDY